MWPRIAARAQSPSEVFEVSALLSARWACLNAFITQLHDLDALSVRNHESRSAGSPGCALQGLPLAVKDNFCTKGVRTTCGSKMLSSYVPPYTATVVQRLLDAGMFLVGKTNMDSFAMGSGSVDSHYGPVRNPWTWISRQVKPAVGDSFSQTDINVCLQQQPGRIPTCDPARDDDATDFHIAGGSSGGSAAAVACGIVYGALGSDTGGSVRIPASYCGVVGLKPTQGLLSRHGLISLVNSLDCPGILTQTVDDCVSMLNAVAGHDPLDSTTFYNRDFLACAVPAEPSLRGVTVGIPKEYHGPHTSPEVLAVWDRVAGDMEKAGATIVPVSLPHTQHSISCYSVLNACDVASNMARYDGIEFGYRAEVDTSTEELYSQTRHESLNDVVRGRIFAGNFFLLRSNYAKYYSKACKARRLICQDFRRVFDEVDILLTPTVIGEAPLHSDFTSQSNRHQCMLHDIYTQPSNLAGVPAVSVPVRLSSNYLPLSVQIIGRQFAEQQVLTAAKWVELTYRCPRLNTDISRNTDQLT